MKKIGIIDSGIGGLTILDKLLDKNVDGEFYYISDEENVPYGEKSQAFMLTRTRLMVDELLQKGVECILLACNTLTAETIDILRFEYKVLFVGVEPFINYLNKAIRSKNDKFALILTKATFSSKKFQDLKTKVDPAGEVQIFPLAKLAIIIERLRKVDFGEIKLDVLKEIEHLKEQDFTHLILGCTHYPIIGEFLEQELGLKVIDPHLEIVNRVVDICELDIVSSQNRMFYYNPNLSNSWKNIKLEKISILNIGSLRTM